ncbi:MAG: NAD(+)--rifampin ADP-ribosyltransferase [Terracoccus sp.]
MTEDSTTRTRVTLANCRHVDGPFLHGTAVALETGDEVEPGHGSHFRPARALAHVYFTTLEETAAWGAELAGALSGDEGRGHVYVVEPLGPFEDDPNVTDKRFPGNPTQSYRSGDPLRVVGELERWQGHSPEMLQDMLARLSRLREAGLDVIED